MPFLMDPPEALALREELICLKNANTPDCDFCAGTAPGDAGLALAYSSGGSIVHQLESLILAQNERWRHA